MSVYLAKSRKLSGRQSASRPSGSRRRSRPSGSWRRSGPSGSWRRHSRPYGSWRHAAMRQVRVALRCKWLSRSLSVRDSRFVV